MAVILSFLKAQLFETVPFPTEDLSGQTVLLTGANSGLGLDCAKHLVRLNVSRLILACRTTAKGQQAKIDIISSIPSGIAIKTEIEAWELEMTSYSSIKSFAERVDNLARLDGAILNAGALMKDFVLAEDNECTITVNVVSTTLLALLLLPKLRQSASQSNVTPHLSMVGSVVHHFAKKNDLTNPARGQILSALGEKESFKDGLERYNLSKLMLMFIVRELAARVSVQESNGKPFVIVNCVAPGWCKTPLFRSDDGGAGGRLAMRVLGRECEEGSRTLVHAITTERDAHGQYLSENKVKPASPFVRSQEGSKVQKALWEEMLNKLETIRPGISANV